MVTVILLPWNSSFRNRPANEAFWIHPPGDTGLARCDDCIALILIAESTKHVIKLAIHLGNLGLVDISAFLTIKRRIWVRFVILSSRGHEPGTEEKTPITRLLLFLFYFYGLFPCYQPRATAECQLEPGSVGLPIETHGSTVRRCSSRSYWPDLSPLRRTPGPSSSASMKITPASSRAC